MIKHTIFAVFIGIALFVGYLVTYVGAFRDVAISEGTAEPFVLLGKEHNGAYHKIVPIIEEVETWAKANGIDCSQSFGFYEDDPKKTEEERLKSFGGCWISNSEKAVQQLPAGFQIRKFEAPYYVKAVFEGSPGIGPFKVYPKVDDYIRAKNLEPIPGVIEIYVIQSQKEMTTTYYFPVKKPTSN